MAARKGNREPLEATDANSIQIKRSVTGTIKTNTGNSQFYNKFGITLHNTSMEESETDTSHIASRKTSSSSSSSSKAVVMMKITNLDDCGTKFPKLEECAHFHYDFVELAPIQVSLSNENQENQSSEMVFHIQVTSKDKTWTLTRSFDNLRTFDRQLHKCIFDRKFSLLPELGKNVLTEERMAAMKKLVTLYMNRFTSIAGNMINCGPVLSWLELDNRGNRLIISDDSAINTPAVGAAHVIKRYIAQDRDEISFEVGDIISIIDMPPKEESLWWRGKKGFEVGFFPAECVELIRDKLPQAVTSKLPSSKPKPVLHKHGKLITLLRNFFSSRPARTQLKRSGIVKERVFGCDLGEHLLNTGREIPLVLERCAETIEAHGIVDGIYRLSGVASNIQKLRNEFDEERDPCLTDECYLQDIHSISSLLKAYFRDLPNPLFTFQLYDKFLAAMQDEENKLIQIHDVIQQLPPPHYRTAKYLMNHLHRISQHGRQTGMHCKNLAIVWAPNLLRSKDLELACSTAALQGVGVQAIVTEYLISHADLIFSDQLQHLTASGYPASGSLQRARPKSLALSTPTKLLSLEEARALVNTAGNSPKQNYIEVGGGPASLPSQYHTVIELPSKKKSRKDRKSPSGWRSIFSKKAQSSKVKESDRSESVHSVSSSAVGATVSDGYDEDDGMITCKLRSVRSADSLLNDTNRHPSYSRLSDDASNSTTFVNPYAEGYEHRRDTDATCPRSVSANNSYSESEMEPIIDVSPRDEVFLEPDIDNEYQELGSLPALNLLPAGSVPAMRPMSQLIVSSLDSSQPLKPKRSKSTSVNQPEVNEPVAAPHRVTSEMTVKDSSLPKAKVTSPAKRKKAKAPLPPTAPPRGQKVHGSGGKQALDTLVTIDLMESPGARRRLYSSHTPEQMEQQQAVDEDTTGAAVELETSGLEGAPGQLASCNASFTDDEAFNTQNLSLTTDSETETDRREGPSFMDAVQESIETSDRIVCTEERIETWQLEKRAAPSYSNSSSLSTDRTTCPDLDKLCHSPSETVGISYLQIDSSSANEVNYSMDKIDYLPTQCIDSELSGDGKSTTSASQPSPCDDLMEKSLDSVLKEASDIYYSSDDGGQQAAAQNVLVSHQEMQDSTSDSQLSAATMSTNFTTSSELVPVSTSSTSDDDIIVTSAPLHAKGRSVYRPLVEYSVTSDSDTTTPSRDEVTPVISSPLPAFPNADTALSDSDTELAGTPVDMNLNIDLSDAEVVFVDPDARPQSRDREPPPLSSECDKDVSCVESQSPTRLAAPPADHMGDVSPTSSASDPVCSESKQSMISLIQMSHTASADGYLADRSCSASPAFAEVHDKSALEKEHDIYAAKDIQNMNNACLDAVTEIVNDTQVSNLRSDAVTDTEATKDLKTSVDSLLFDMEDLDQQSRFSLSEDKLNTSGNEQEFFCPQMPLAEKGDDQRSEPNMSVSPDTCLDDKPKQVEGSEGDTSVPTLSTESWPRPAADLVRKQSVRELLSKFESSTQSATESSGGSGNELISQSSERTGSRQEHSRTIGMLHATSQEAGRSSLPTRKPSPEIQIAIRNIQSGYSSSEDSDSAKSRSHSLYKEPSLQPSEVPNSDTNTDSDKELSSSPRIQDLRRRFEESSSAGDKKCDVQKPSIRASSILVRPDRCSTLDHGEKKKKNEKQDKQSSDGEQAQREQESKSQEMVTSRQSLVLNKPLQGNPEEDRHVPLPVGCLPDHSKSTDPKSKRSTLSERLQSLSERYKSCEDDAKPSAGTSKSETTDLQPAAVGTTAVGQSARPVPRPRSRTHRKPLARGQCFAKYVQPESLQSVTRTEPAVAADSQPTAKVVRERLKKFESFSSADRPDTGPAPVSEPATMSSSLPHATFTSPKGQPLSDSDMNTANAAGSFLSSAAAAPKFKASTLPRGVKVGCGKVKDTDLVLPSGGELGDNNSDHRHISVRDLSRQFERQLSEQSDPSRTSTLSHSCASDVTNGNTTTLDTESTNQNAINRNWTTIL